MKSLSSWYFDLSSQLQLAFGYQQIMGYASAWKRLSPTQLNLAIQAFSLVAIFFEGYDQVWKQPSTSSPAEITNA